MTDKPNFVLVQDDAPAPARTGGLLARLEAMAASAATKS